MIHQNKNRIALLLMTSSLLLLGIFLAIWMKNLYSQEVERLAEKSSFVFISSIQKAEQDYFKEHVLNSIMQNKSSPHDSIRFTSISMNIEETSDVKGGAIITVQDTVQTRNTNEMDIKVILNGEEMTNDENIGSLVSYLLKQSIDSTTTYQSINHKDSFILNSFKEIVIGSPKAKDLPVEFKVIKMVDSLSTIPSILSETYKDRMSGDRFALKVESFKSFIFQQLWPQFLFSLLLFSITALAFFFIYKNLKEQQQLTAMKNELIGNITHELKTPIATVGVAIEALQSFGVLNDPERTKEYLDISKKELNRLSILVDKVLNTSLFEKSDFQLKSEEINLKELIQEVLDSMKLQFQNRKAEVQFVTEGKSFAFKGDKIHLTSVVYNLIDNALKYSPTLPKISVNLAASDLLLGLKVQDNGMGIPITYQNKVFDKFFRVPSQNEHSIKGHGLGLNYVKKVVEKHKGTIVLQSQEGKGTCFKITFPL